MFTNTDLKIVHFASTAKKYKQIKFLHFFSNFYKITRYIFITVFKLRSFHKLKIILFLIKRHLIFIALFLYLTNSIAATLELRNICKSEVLSSCLNNKFETFLFLMDFKNSEKDIER